MNEHELTLGKCRSCARRRLTKERVNRTPHIYVLLILLVSPIWRVLSVSRLESFECLSSRELCCMRVVCRADSCEAAGSRWHNVHGVFMYRSDGVRNENDREGSGINRGEKLFCLAMREVVRHNRAWWIVFGGADFVIEDAS
ncbi:hypothetical protein Salat_2115400 [Sesamum alatum]|uniref:Uncharacterized protein n=1 Tax=Sesamum alatum TaxID=300844 RepID=A0AAE1Y230_9LAMI|nr:hypothetical protein Salat_2115400 [Sesamum alatum]